MDLVIDGPEEKAQRLQSILREDLPYFSGNKEHWEVRLLREPIGDKAPLLRSFEFLNQHTDSHSTGMIELTGGFKSSSEIDSQPSMVKDLRDWGSKESKFLQDVLDGRLTYYDSKTHKETQRYKEGKNPEIFSVIRYFTKLFQYQLEPREKDLKRLKELINDFQIKSSRQIMHSTGLKKTVKS